MPPSQQPASPSKLRLISILSVSQLVGWGTTFDMPSVLARPMARDLAMPFETIFGGLSVMMLMVALISPRVGRLLVRLGAARVLATGSGIISAGLALLASAQGPVSYFAAWVLIGLGGAFALTVPANTAVVEREGAGSKRTMSTMSVFTGLSSAVFWPVLTFGDAALGWRSTLFIAAAAHLLIMLPMHLFALPPRRIEATDMATGEAVTVAPLAGKRRMLALGLIAAGSSLIALLTFGISPSLIELLKQSGATPELALTLGSLRAVIGISARFGSTVLIERVSTVVSGLVGSVILLASFALLTLFAPSLAAPMGFVLLYGAGAGIVTIVRTLLPLAFFSRAEFALISSRVALAQYAATAVAPFLFAAILENLGLEGVLAVSVAICIVFLGVILGLMNLQRAGAARS
ncbi:MAG TPA: MFS transporter [Ensifer sp.]|nr:MFS transporter [Ensifer sp.]